MSGFQIKLSIQAFMIIFQVMLGDTIRPIRVIIAGTFVISLYNTSHIIIIAQMFNLAY